MATDLQNKVIITGMTFRVARRLGALDEVRAPERFKTHAEAIHAAAAYLKLDHTV